MGRLVFSPKPYHVLRCTLPAYETCMLKGHHNGTDTQFAGI